MAQDAADRSVDQGVYHVAQTVPVWELAPARRPVDEPLGACDWGGCDEYAGGWRYSAEHGWLPVCAAHGEASDGVPA